MQKTTINSLFLLILPFASFYAHAIQFGVELGTNSGDITSTGGSVLTFGLNATPDTDRNEIGFALNACETCRWFGYRLNTGYFTGNIEYSSTNNADLSGFYSTNTVALKLAYTEKFNFWVGASIYSQAWRMRDEYNTSSSAYALGVGPTLGMDFGGSGTMFSIEAGTKQFKIDVDNTYFDDHELDDTFVRLTLLF